MNEGKRPGGLTALAVLNFVFSGFEFLGILTMIAMFALFRMAAEHMDDSARDQWAAIQKIGWPLLIGLLVASIVAAILLLLSGIGYIKQKKFLGRTLGNIYAIISIADSVVSAMVLEPVIGGGFHIGTMIGLIYPLLTLILLNTTFKEDFGN